MHFEHRHQSNSNLFDLFPCWSIIMMLGLKSDPQIAAKTGIPAGLLFRRIWYPVWKSGGLGITEYRQGRPLHVDVTCANTLTVMCDTIRAANMELVA